MVGSGKIFKIEFLRRLEKAIVGLKKMFQEELLIGTSKSLISSPDILFP